MNETKQKNYQRLCSVNEFLSSRTLPALIAQAQSWSMAVYYYDNIPRETVNGKLNNSELRQYKHKTHLHSTFRVSNNYLNKNCFTSRILRFPDEHG